MSKKVDQAQLKNLIFIASPNADFLSIIQLIINQTPGYELYHVQAIDELLEPATPRIPQLFMIDGRSGTEICAEWVQSTRMSYSQTPILVLCGSETELQFGNLKKNGAQEILHILYDQEFILEIITSLVPPGDQNGEVPLASLNLVSSEDFIADTELNFDLFVHLPANHKTIVVRKKGAIVDDRILNKAQQTGQSFYVKKTELKQFFEYARTAQTMKNSAKPVTISEKFFKTKKTINQIMSVFMNAETSDFQAGKDILDRCKNIIVEFELLVPLSPRQAFDEMKRFTGRNPSPYHDAICVCAYAALMGWILELPQPKIEILALSGLLHNIGLSKMPTSTLNKKIDTLSPEELKSYHSYPEKSVFMVKTKKVALDLAATNAILEHRENADGSGFPRGKLAADTNDLAQIVRLACRIQQLTCLGENDVTMTPGQAFDFLRAESTNQAPKHNLQLLTNLFAKISAG